MKKTTTMMLAAVAAMGWMAIRAEEIPDEVKAGIARVKAVAIADGEMTAVEYGKGGLRVAFVLRPTPKSFIRCELGLADPSKWDGRFWGLGNGGWAGHVSCRRDGVSAYVHTDLGTSRTDRNVIVEDREVLTDYCWRATHLAAVEGKRLAAAYYGRKPDKCYFHGASCGGRQGIVEATRFPEDYDGIVSEVPGFTERSRVAHAWKREQLKRKYGGAWFSKDEADAIRAGELAYFAKTDPEWARGRFILDPYPTKEKLDGCWAEIVRREPKLADREALWRELFDPVVVKGEPYVAGRLLGIELDGVWGFVMTKFYGRARPLDFTEDDLARFVREPDLQLTADLSAFKRRGGKIIMYGGMEDLSCPEPEMRAYYDDVLKTMGGLDPVSDFFAYYAVPGRSHGAKGEPNGPGQVGRPRDLAAKVVAWVEQDERPGAIDFDWVHETKRLTVTPYPENRVIFTDRRGELSAKPLDVQGMIDAAPKGATVTVPAGDWEVKPFRLKSDLTLEIAKGATLWASTNLDDYAAAEGQRFFIGAVGATNVAIVGGGVFDGRGHAFTEKKLTDGASQPQRLPVMMRFIRCRNLRLEGFTYRQGGAWGCHLCNCDGVTVRRLTCFNHINHTNDGIDIESRNVLIEDCTIDADDDAIVFKAETDKSFTVTNALVRNCTLRSCCNALKFGTGSYCDFRDVTVENCRFERARGNFCFGWYKYMNQYWPHIPGVTNHITGIAGMALEVADGGSLENVTLRDITIEGYQTPIFIRLERRHEPAAGRATYLRNVLIENVTGEVAESRVACSITGVPGLRPRDITLRNVNLRFPGGGTAEDAAATVPEKEKEYPEAFMFDFQPLPAWAFYVRHADGIRFENVTCSLAAPDARPRFVFDDADVKVEERSAAIRDIDRPWTLEAPRTEVKEHVPGVYWIEAENFADYGGWLLDTQFAHKMGSGYLLAAGVGKPKSAAQTTIDVTTPGRYRVWARTKDWVPEFHPGTFALEVNGRRLKTLGASGRDWSWEDAGSVDLAAGTVELKLVDLSGYYARCDAVVLSRDAEFRPPDDGEALAALRARCTGLPEGIADGGTYDVVVVGGGPAGVPAAIAAARHGAKVALLQDRPVLGGNISSELGVLLNGSASPHPGYREGGIIEEAVLRKAAAGRGGKLSFSRVFAQMAAEEENLRSVLGARVYAVEKDGERIAAALARDTLTGVRTRYRAKVFVDATGDGWLGFFAGAKHRYGREGAKEFDESCAPDEPDLTTMSGCLLGGYGLPRLVDVGKPSPYETPKWVWPLPEGFYRESDGLRFKWWLEHPGDLDDCNDPELARDSLLRIFFAYWGWMKNGTPDRKIRKLASTYELVSLPYMNGRREGLRLMGDYVFTERDAFGNPFPEDGVAHTGWHLDTHDPLGVNNPKSTGSWRKVPKVPQPVGIPYRILYSANVPNLFMAGRDVSCSHVGLGTLRVAATCAAMGQAVGTAAAGCARTGLLPRAYGRERIGELQTALMRDDQFIPGKRFADPGNLANGATASATSACAGSPAANVLDGYARTLPATETESAVRKIVEDTGFGNVTHVAQGRSHAWVSDPEAGLPQALTVSLAEPQEACEVRITFDSDFFLPRKWVHHELPTTLVRAYAVEVTADGTNWRTVANVTDNCRRLAVHRFAPCRIAAVRVTVRETYGDPSARIFAVGLWGKEP